MIFSVTEVSNKIKEILEENFGYLKIRGEISGLKIASSGHAYFNLKENSAILCCTFWKFALAKVNFALSDGVEVVACGKITSYAGNSRYQLSVESLELAGIGAMMQILHQLKEKLKKEGLFDQEHKRPIPFLPSRIGIITSITGAVIQDIVHRIKDRCPTSLIVWPVTVQGENAANEATKAIIGFNALNADIKPDVIIIARGGGSIEDLWPFNNEQLVRVVYNSLIPIISAIGHETDYTLVDLVADIRAPTPTAAAEFAVPVVSQLRHNLHVYFVSLENKFLRVVTQILERLGLYSKFLEKYNWYIANQNQRIDELDLKISDLMPKFLTLKASPIKHLALNTNSIHKIFEYKALKLQHANDVLQTIYIKFLENKSQILETNHAVLQSLDYKKVIKRGFALVKTKNGTAVSSKKQAEQEHNLSVSFYDGDIRVYIHPESSE